MSISESDMEAVVSAIRDWWAQADGDDPDDPVDDQIWFVLNRLRANDSDWLTPWAIFGRQTPTNFGRDDV